MNRRVCTVAALMAISVLVATTTITITAATTMTMTMTTWTPLVYAGDYEKSQTIVQTNECGNYWFPLNVLCSNLGSHIQGEKNGIIVEATEAAPDQKQDGNVKTSEVKDEDSEVSQSFAPFP